MQRPTVDEGLLAAFEENVMAKVPRLEEGKSLNATPLVDVTEVLLECARSEYGLLLGGEGVRVYGKFDSKIFGGSVKVRPAVSILHDAIKSGALNRGQTIFEATSGNFGLALGAFRELGLDVVALVSRRLQEGVVRELRDGGIKLIDLDIDICPAPGIEGDPNGLLAKSVVSAVRKQLVELGFDALVFDSVASEAEGLLSRQDVIGLAKLLARAYDGFCPEQYDNELNVEAHRLVTGPELDEQLRGAGLSLGDVDLVCALGTGGTATGISHYAKRAHGRKVVRVVYPQAGQDVAGIRTREKASGLSFYKPEYYLGEHEVDFEQTHGVFDFFNAKGFDVGESGALALFACIQLLNFGQQKKFVVIVADGAGKYLKQRLVALRPRREQVSLQQAASSISEYGRVVWVHGMFVPKEKGVEVIAQSLGCDAAKVGVAAVSDVQLIVNGGEPTEKFGGLIPDGGSRVLLVCMVGGTSLAVARVLAKRGIEAESLAGGISGLPMARALRTGDLVQMARS